MIYADVQSLARAAPEPAAPPRSTSGDAGNSFDQFLQAVTTSDRSSAADDAARGRSSEREVARDDRITEREKPVENKPVDQQSSNDQKVDAKPSDTTKTTKTEEGTVSQENTQTEVIDESIQETIAAAVAAQIAAIAAPVQQVEALSAGDTVEEPNIPAAAISVTQNQQSTVISLPETEPQPLPDELKQALQQPKAEAKDFQSLVNTASQDLETQTVTTDAKVTAQVTTSPVAQLPELKALDTQEPAVKVVNLNVQPEDLVELEPNRGTNGLYAMASTRTENLVHQKTLPLIQKVSAEVVELAREQGQSMRIQIHPENLGKIDLRLVSNSDGMKVVMTAEIPATAKLLESHLDQLQKQLSNAGVTISGMSVNSQGAQGQFANQSLTQSQSDGTRPNTPAFQQESETATTQVVKVSTSSLDYRV